MGSSPAVCHLPDLRKALGASARFSVSGRDDRVFLQRLGHYYPIMEPKSWKLGEGKLLIKAHSNSCDL